jgi:hypothetical protein
VPFLRKAAGGRADTGLHDHVSFINEIGKLFASFEKNFKLLPEGNKGPSFELRHCHGRELEAAE